MFFSASSMQVADCRILWARVWKTTAHLHPSFTTQTASFRKSTSTTAFTSTIDTSTRRASNQDTPLASVCHTLPLSTQVSPLPPYNQNLHTQLPAHPVSSRPLTKQPSQTQCPPS